MNNYNKVKAISILIREKKRLQKSFDPLFDKLPSINSLRSLVEKGILNYRDRIFSPWITLCTFIFQVLSPDSSCRQAVLRTLTNKFVQDKVIFSSNTAAYCKARQRLPLEVISAGVRLLARTLHKQAMPFKKWHDRPIKLIDGSTISMPDTEENQKGYPQNPTQRTGLGFPLARILVIVCLASGAILNAAIGSYRDSELVLLRTLLDCFSSGDIVVADRYYCSYFLIALLQQRNIDLVFRMNASRKYDFRKGIRLGKYDHISYWDKPKKPDWMDDSTYVQLPDKLTIREIKNKKTIIITTLLASAFYSKNQIISLYRNRWFVELDLRIIKSVMQMDILRCKTPEMIKKEIWVYFLAYNLLRTIMLDVSQNHQISPRKLSFKAALQAFNNFYISSLQIPAELYNKFYKLLLATINQHRIGNRPNRIEPRAIKRRPKPLNLLMKPRNIARLELIYVA